MKFLRSASGWGAPVTSSTGALDATVMSTVGSAGLSVSDPGRLTNGDAALRQPLQVAFSKASWTGPVSDEPVTITFKQRIDANETLRAGTYSRNVTFTLAMTTP